MTDGGSVTILNVDDNEVGRYAITQMLKRAGYNVLEAATGGDALRIVQSAAPDLVILDVNLPDIIGLEVCRRIKSDPATAHVLVVHLSATSVEVADQVAGLEGGADAYLTWPIDSQVLLATLRSLLRARAAEAQAALIGRQWQATVDATRDGIAVLDPAGRIVRANNTMAALTGRPVTGLNGERLYELLRPDDGDVTWTAFAAALRSGERATNELALGGRWYLASLDPIRGPFGVLAGGVQVFTDITDLKRLYEAEKTARSTLAAIVDQMPIGLLVTDTAGRVIMHNERADGIAGRDLRGVSLLDPDALPTVPRDGEGEAASVLFARALDEGSAIDDLELEVVIPGAGPRSILVSMAPVRDEDDRLVAMVVAFSDISERKAAEAIRDTFIGMLSHELRTPVTSILGFSRLLADDGRSISTEIRSELVVDIADEAQRLHRLVEDLLILARTERGVPLDVADPVLLHRVIPAVVDVERRLWPEIRFETTIGDLGTVSGDDSYAGQVVRNLLSNAAKYGRDAGVVELTAQREGDGATIRVLDRGPGVAADELERLFEPFYRTSEAKRQASGAGIGLFVCRQLVTAMGGRMWALERDGGGMEFGFHLPAYAEAGTADLPAHARHAAAEPPAPR